MNNSVAVESNMLIHNGGNGLTLTSGEGLSGAQFQVATHNLAIGNGGYGIWSEYPLAPAIALGTARLETAQRHSAGTSCARRLADRWQERCFLAHSFALVAVSPDCVRATNAYEEDPSRRRPDSKPGPLTRLADEPEPTSPARTKSTCQTGVRSSGNETTQPRTRLCPLSKHV